MCEHEISTIPWLNQEILLIFERSFNIVQLACAMLKMLYINEMAKVRIKDIAEIANVSIGTVDRVIHKRGEVSLATRERIQKLLTEYNYTPDIIASSLA